MRPELAARVNALWAERTSVCNAFAALAERAMRANLTTWAELHAVVVEHEAHDDEPVPGAQLTDEAGERFAATLAEDVAALAAVVARARALLEAS